MKQKIISDLEALINEAKSIRYYTSNSQAVVGDIKRKTEMLIRKAGNDKLHYIDDLKKLRFSLTMFTSDTPESASESAFYRGIENLTSLLNVIIDDIRYDIQQDTNLPEISSQNLNSVFIVHGHDNHAEIELARFIEKLGFSPIILHEQASSGQTIIEKIESYSNVGFGVVLYTPCDVGAVKTEVDNLQPRARQNVVFEHGYLIGKLGRNKVCAIVKDKVETPNDISGVVYINMDIHQAWHLRLAKEMKAAGYLVDMNKL